MTMRFRRARQDDSYTHPLLHIDCWDHAAQLVLVIATGGDAVLDDHPHTGVGVAIRTRYPCEVFATADAQTPANFVIVGGVERCVGAGEPEQPTTSRASEYVSAK